MVERKAHGRLFVVGFNYFDASVEIRVELFRSSFVCGWLAFDLHDVLANMPIGGWFFRS